MDVGVKFLQNLDLKNSEKQLNQRSKSVKNAETSADDPAKTFFNLKREKAQGFLTTINA